MGRPNRIVVLLILVCVVFASAVNVAPTTLGGGEQGSSCKKIVLIAGKNAPGHGGPGQHFYEGGIELLKECLDSSANVTGVETQVIFERLLPKDPNILDGADTIVIYSEGWSAHPLGRPEWMKKIGELMGRGVGLVCLHYAVVPPEGNEGEWLEWIGGYYDMTGYSKNPFNSCVVSPGAKGHPICRGWESFAAYDEFYYRIRFKEGDERLVPIMTAVLPKEGRQCETIAWAVERKDGGRGFGFTGGHFHCNWYIESFRKMVLNAVLWTAKVDVPQEGVRSAAK